MARVQTKLFDDNQIKVVEIERTKRERTTHHKRYHDKHVEIEHLATGNRLTGYYGHIHQSSDFRFWNDTDGFWSNIMSKSKWRIIGIIKEDE